jgi:competence protein ComEC
MEPLKLDGKTPLTKEKKTGIIVIIVAILLIVLAVVTNFFGADNTLFETPQPKPTSEPQTNEGIEENYNEDNWEDFNKAKEEIANLLEGSIDKLQNGQYEEFFEEINEKISEEGKESVSGETLLSGDTLKVIFFDVGQGESIFVENKGSKMLVDAGNNPDGKYISKYLRKELNLTKLDYLICTHAHEDHIGGIDIIIEDLDIGTFYMPDKGQDVKSFNDVINWAGKKNLAIVSPAIGTKFKVGDAVCEVMTQNNSSEELNETSIVIELTYKNKKILLTGDMEPANEQSRSWNDIDVLKVAHHGSKYTTTDTFLAQVKPEYAIISCGKNNDYYYPHEAVLKRLKDVGCKNIYTTAEEGTIVLITDGENIEISSMDKSFDGNIDEAA